MPDVAGLADLVLPRVDDCADRALRRLRETGHSLLATDHDELRGDIREVLRLSLELFRDARQPVTLELGWCLALGRRRAQQGVALHDVVRWLHSTALVLWELLADLARDSGTDLAQRLVERAAFFWSMLDVLSSAISEGHYTTAENLAVEVRRQGLALLAGVQGHPEGVDATEELARGLGIDPHGPVVVAVHAGIHRSCGTDFPWVVAEEADRTVVIAQPANADAGGERDVAEVLDGCGIAPAGIGLNRRGMAGAQLSLRDAEFAYGAGIALRRVAPFREHWLEALGVAYRREHEPLVSAAVERVRSDPQLRLTLTTFLECHGNLTACGRALELHPNTVAYRLRQLADQAGIDARQATGLALAQTALVLAEMDPPTSASAAEAEEAAELAQGRKAKIPPGWSVKPIAV